jgi:predicted AlkP superfamily pyrophosphatase or phosphodiesterase
MQRTVVIDIVGLSDRLIGQHTPFIHQWSQERSKVFIQPIVPAVTCSMQSTYLTGKLPNEHGIVGNGWYFEDECEVKFWRQSNKLVQAPKIWDEAKQLDPNFTCANLFWWYNMYSSADYSVTPRPNYLADGRKIPDVYSHPAHLRDDLQKKLGQFPLFEFWGPKTSIRSSQWIADAAKTLEQQLSPTLSLVYLPHLDYCLQKFGHDDQLIASDLLEIDTLVRELVQFYQQRNIEVILLSEYGITNVSKPVALNRVLRKHDWLQVREERGLELLDAGASKAFAVADHQVAHLYVRDSKDIREVKSLIESVEGVSMVWDGEEQSRRGLDHSRSGDLVVLAEAESWFTYYYWLDDRKAPDFARTVDIHRKPGYDPVEMFADPEITWLLGKVGWKLLRKKLGFRVLMDIIPLDPGLIKGSHGLVPSDRKDWPVVITSGSGPGEEIPATEVYDIIWGRLTNQR